MQGHFNFHKCRGPVANIESSRDPRFLFQAEKATAAILAFLKTTGVGKMPGERDWKDEPKAEIDRKTMRRNGRTRKGSRELVFLL
jgi:hypothetical protein